MQVKKCKLNDFFSIKALRISKKSITFAASLAQRLQTVIRN